jgi:hypothetical protein
MFVPSRRSQSTLWYKSYPVQLTDVGRSVDLVVRAAEAPEADRLRVTLMDLGINDQGFGFRV